MNQTPQDVRDIIIKISPSIGQEEEEVIEDGTPQDNKTSQENRIPQIHIGEKGGREVHPDHHLPHPSSFLEGGFPTSCGSGSALTIPARYSG